MNQTRLMWIAAASTILCTPPLSAASLSSAVQTQVRKSTFEIVMKKPEADSLTYEKPLPLDLLPFRERTDKYISVGSAFAIGDNRFVTAAHVIGTGFGSQFGQPAVREGDGPVHPITAIYKYSSLEDYVEFSCDECARGHALKISRDLELDSEVFAVGNALGEGIVVRDGLLTSMTPESRYGKWKWLRFSAAASPGNSGGPLLDAKGNVIGIVLRKSESENLNYALPMAVMLDAPVDTAKIDSEMRYWLPMLNDPVAGQRDHTFGLPMTYPQVATEVLKYKNSFMDDLSAELLQKNADKLFPKGAGAAELLYINASSDAPAIIAQKEDGNWDAYAGQVGATAQLPDNGFVTLSQYKVLAIVRIRRPDSLDPRQFYGDSRQFMDMLLKASPWKRYVGREEVRVTSAGKAKDEQDFVDDYGRKWKQWTWPIEFQDVNMTAIVLPTPEGYIGFMRWSRTGEQHDVELDLRSSANFLHLALSGTLKQWQEYLALADQLPRPLANDNLTIAYGDRFELRTPRFAFKYTQSQQKIQPDGHLTLSMDYVPDESGAATWDVTGLTAIEDVKGDAVISLGRHVAPAATLPKDYAVGWQTLVARQPPYSGETGNEFGVSSITAVHPYPGKPVASPSLLYTLQRARTGDFKKRQMQKELQGLSANLQVLE